MKSYIKSSALIMLMMFGLLVASTNQVKAEIWICFGSNCFWGDGSCDGWCPDAPASPTCEDCATMYNPSSNDTYVLAQNQHVWLVIGARRIPMVSDEFATFISKIKKRYEKQNRKDPKIQKQISEEYTEFLKSGDTGKVSKSRLIKMIKGSKLRVEYKDNSFGIEPSKKK